MNTIQQLFEQEFNDRIKSLIDSALSEINIIDLVSTTVTDRINTGAFQQYINDTIKQHVSSVNITTTALAQLDKRGTAVLQSHMPNITRSITDRVDGILSQVVENKLKNFDYPANSIDPSLIDISKLKISTSNITDFGNTAGIEDMSASVQLTIMDGAVVVEDNLHANHIHATTITVDTLIVRDMATDQPWYKTMKSSILADIPPAPAAKDWSFKIAEMDAKIEVNTKAKGALRELDVSGEALLSGVLYTTPGNNRVGINTMDPSDALTVWDQETEVVIGKHKLQESYIGTRRRQSLNIGANNIVGMTVTSTGVVVIDQLQLMGRVISQADSIPGIAAKRGDLVLNNNPVVNSYIGWVCLDGLRWAGFGKIE